MDGHTKLTTGDIIQNAVSNAPKIQEMRTFS